MPRSRAYSSERAAWPQPCSEHLCRLLYKRSSRRIPPPLTPPTTASSTSSPVRTVTCPKGLPYAHRCLQGRLRGLRVPTAQYGASKQYIQQRTSPSLDPTRYNITPTGCQHHLHHVWTAGERSPTLHMNFSPPSLVAALLADYLNVATCLMSTALLNVAKI